MLRESDSFTLASQLSELQSKLFRGRLDIKGSNQTKWSLYFYLGRLVWSGGGKYPQERWHRLLNHYCGELARHEEFSGKTAQFSGYNLLLNILRQDRTKRSRIVELVRDNLNEVLFDILQQEYQLKNSQQNSQLIFTYDPEDYPRTAFTLIRTEQILAEVTQQWQKWQQRHLAPYSPNLIPAIRQPERLKQNFRNTLDEYVILTKLVDGRRTIRSIALELQQPLLDLTRFFAQYVNAEMMSFVEIQQVEAKDSPEPKADKTDKSHKIQRLLAGNLSAYQTPEEDSPLVVCIDDSPTICTQMKQIITEEGCRFVDIQDPITAIPQLLKIKPDLIFLDLIMPIVNGYELCSQIRRISMAKDLPIVILTGQDGIIDRVRAKIVGASDFIAKPVNRERVQSILFRYVLIK
ncbi:MAG: response regulator [Xenococcaceae cyanobacterium]